MKRVFIALKVEPGEYLQKIYSTFRSLLSTEKIKWVDMSSIHLTLVFLGDTKEEMITAAGTVLETQCSGYGEFSFTLKGTGVFKNLHDPRIIWIGIEKCDELIKLNTNIVSGLKNVGFIFEGRPFKPHLTLGRIKFLENPNALTSALNKYKDTLIQKVMVTEVVLYESILKTTGPLYKPLGKYKLS